ncbi:MAG: hypothetical protein K6F95_00770 [Selenomonas sp.]|uniref:hypothetical protein n=1 Tax=Selenomonas sp. TaxID=2053611 RepID=UPI0025E2EBD6|nr:hypothetical protein [Selenomonas sp.]MCR5756429.1 hypothetical protein [Selenomonas sp.]
MENTTETQTPVQVVITKSEKNMGLSIVLTALFGPLGLFYSSIIGGFIMLVISFVGALITLGVSLIITWPLCILWAYLSTKRYNAKLSAATTNL